MPLFMPALPHHDPLNVIASREQINARHAELEAAPIQVFDFMIDCDERSERRMRNTLERWDDLELLPGVVELVEINGVPTKVINWTMADNSVEQLTKSMLENVFEEMLRKRTQRAAVLFAKSKSLKSNSATTLRDIDNAESWLTPL